MITNEDSNVQLTPEQLQAIDVAQQRLYNLQNETTVATRTLSALKNDSVVALKDKDYQEKLLADVVSKVTAVQIQLNTLEISANSSREILNSLTQEIAKKSDILAVMEADFKKRDDDLAQKERELTDRETQVSAKEADLSSMESLLSDKHAKIKVFADGIL